MDPKFSKTRFEQRALSDALRQLLDRDASLHAADVGLAEHQLVEGNDGRDDDHFGSTNVGE